MKKLDLPATMMVKCNCGKMFEAKRTGSFGYRPQYCQECIDGKKWQKEFNYRKK